MAEQTVSEPASKSKQRKCRERVCVDCGQTESIRDDNPAIRCRTCASRIAGTKSGIKKSAAAKLNGCSRACEVCGTRHYNSRFCSKPCHQSVIEREVRTCKFCSANFEIRKSTLRTNASGNFCSRLCYEKFLCRTDKVSGRGSQWRRIRKGILRIIPCCVLCGTTKGIQVHHVIPYRLTRDNSPRNLVPLCRKHHREIESLFLQTETDDFDENRAMIWWNIASEWRLLAIDSLQRAKCLF